ncbi:hypothetical protein J3Q64DRAFT_1625030, partial [Phycomyces blakesleeanus]
KFFLSFIRPFMLQQLSYFQNSEAFSLSPLLNKDQRKNNITDTNFSIWQNIFQTMDFFLPAFSITKSLLLVATLFCLPLYRSLQINSSHWFHRHPTFASYLSLTVDRRQRRSCLKAEGEYTWYRQLYQKLFHVVIYTSTFT